VKKNAAPAKSGVQKRSSKTEGTDEKFITARLIGQAATLLSMLHR